MKKHTSGFTLVEVLVAFLVSLTLFSSLIAAFLAIKSLNTFVRHKAQAVQVMRGEIDLLKVTSFNSISNSSITAPYDAGPDGVFGTVDDLQGTLTVTVQDFLDMDGDGNTTETSIDIDGDGVNDATAIKPIRVTFSWTQYVLGQSKTYTVSADTLIAA